MRPRPEREREELDRRRRRKQVQFAFLFSLLVFGLLLIWQSRVLVLPIAVGALLAYLFRPLKDRFYIPGLPHEARVTLLFAAVVLMFAVGFSTVRQHIPSEKQKLELKVRLKYKLNKKAQEFLGAKNTEGRPSPMAALLARETEPMLARINEFLDLTPEEQDLFLRYSTGYLGESPIEERFLEYFQANLNAGAAVSRDPAASTLAPAPAPTPMVTARTKDPVGEAKVREMTEAPHSTLKDELSIWILAPLVFLFLGFDNGQIRRYFIGLIPNRYFEMSLTVMDELDEAIGAYLRGTALECGLVGFTIGLGLFLLGFPFPVAMLVGFISGLANAIPFLGHLIGVVVAVGYALIAEDLTAILPFVNNENLPIAVIIVIAVATLLDNVLYAPVVLGGAVHLHPLVVILAVFAGSAMLGFWGMLLAIPTVVVVKTAAETLYKELRDYRII
ncbi:MAG: AI-2E family transporter [Bdellovibrionales bacterium]